MLLMKKTEGEFATPLKPKISGYPGINPFVKVKITNTATTICNATSNERRGSKDEEANESRVMGADAADRNKESTEYKH